MMTVGFGVSVGTVNTVCAVADGTHRRRCGSPPATWRTTLTFDSAGAARVGRIPKHGRALTDFADLTQRGAPTARVGNRSLSAADLVATVAARVLAGASASSKARQSSKMPLSSKMPVPSKLSSHARSGADAPAAGVAVTHPVEYLPRHVDDLRAALDSAGLNRAVLVAEPVAATAWLEEVHGPLLPGLALVYDLGGSGLRVTLVRVGAGCPSDPVVGKSLRSTGFGGRAFGAQLAGQGDRGRAEAGSADAAASARPATTDAEITDLRIAHVRRSLDVIYECLRGADVTMADIDRVLVIGGAARPREVTDVLAEALARPVVVAPDPEHTVAEGAALLARRAPAEDGRRGVTEPQGREATGPDDATESPARGATEPAGSDAATVSDERSVAEPADRRAVGAQMREVTDTVPRRRVRSLPIGRSRGVRPERGRLLRRGLGRAAVTAAVATAAALCAATAVGGDATGPDLTTSDASVVAPYR